MPLSGRGGARATLDRKVNYTAATVRSSGGLCPEAAHRQRDPADKVDRTVKRGGVQDSRPMPASVGIPVDVGDERTRDERVENRQPRNEM